MNKESSRSHFIFTLNVRTRKLNEVTGEDEIKDGRLYLVDLAGSESIGKSGAKGMRATEAKKINKSNEALKRVIESLCNGWSHIPYVVFERGSARMSIISHFHVSITSQEYRSPVPQESHSKVNARIPARL
jgi:hypothetical protein